MICCIFLTNTSDYVMLDVYM